ncbi:hypothetical protein [Streptomyces sp. NPDC001401]|uniref:hypothetical protein n=1 Tax=Streptomyces sp. NPDC001401 TaxID=3364570 RepID=UPI00367AC317
MTRTPSRVLVFAVLSAGALVSASACGLIVGVGPDPETGARQGRTPAASPSAEHSAKPSVAAPASPQPLTEAQAQGALLTQADLGAPWAPTQGAATWRDGVLKAHADVPECRKLLDALYTDDLFGADAAGTRAVTGLDDAMDQAQLRYQVLSLKPADVDRTLAWMKTLPQTCAKFTAVTGRGTVQGVRVDETVLPVVGDARQGLRVTFTGPTADGQKTVLTLDVAVVRVGDDTIALTHGGTGDVSADATKAFVQVGAQRLADVRKQARLRV